ncbi:hypothetical protein EDC31_1608 [Acidomonas methanolica]|uniref:hypothetical protein n=5 Tax=Acidomonas methanolica TaxID=437 RepID=UPI00104F3FB5|nr:hypothetical protein [Acidomonas methanolica]TCS19062.1 hypothetical protein EDC31_1608 [Acidomonas methanolica]
MKFAFVLAERESYPAQTLCRVISASVSGCYAWVGAIPLLKARVPVLSFDAERAADENLEQMISDVDERILYYQGVKKILRGRLRWRKFAEKRDGRADSDGAPRRRRRDTATAVALRHSFVGQGRDVFIESFVEDIIRGGRSAPEVVEKGSDEVPQDLPGLEMD